MRWDGQRLDASDGDALPGLEGSRDLVRTFEAPEFRGMEFLEVTSKSALNKVPGNGFMGGAWTVNPYRGCQHACVYCLAPDTKVLMADGTQRPIGTLAVGEEIIGTEVVGRYRRYVRTVVEATWTTTKRAYRLALADGTEMVASGDHRFLTERGWRHVTGAMSGREQRPYLTTDHRLMGFGSVAPTVTRKVSVEGVAVTSVADLRVIGVQDLATEIDMVDITTGTGDFIANGVISHNCFARNTHTYLDLDAGADFDARVVVKVNVAEALDAELARKRERPERVMLGTNTDPYQRAEGRYRLMPGVIRALAKHGVGISILTKGTLLRRDLPLLAEVAEQVPVEVSMSIAVFDDALQASVEPGTPTTAARLATVRAIRDAGLACTVLVMPVLPWLTDSEEHLDRAFAMLAEAGATGVHTTALHLRPGAREWYLAWLAREHPHLVGRYQRLYAGGANAEKGYQEWLRDRVRAVRRRHRLEVIEERRRRHGPRVEPAAESDPVPTLF